MADDIYMKALQKMNGWSFFELFNKTAKYDTAIKLFREAANNYKLEKNFLESGECYEKIAECYKKIGEYDETINYYMTASKYYKLSDVNQAIRSIKLAIDIHYNHSDYDDSVTKRYLKELASCYEKNNNFEEALQTYKECLNIFNQDNKYDTYTLSIKIAELHMKFDEYSEASKIYENIANSILDNNLLKFKINEQLINAILCSLVSDDIVSVQKKIKQYTDSFISFYPSIEYDFIQKIVDSLINYDKNYFINTVNEYDFKKKLDDLQIIIINKIIKQFDNPKLA